MNKFIQLNEKERSVVSGGFNLKQEAKNLAGGLADKVGNAGEWLDKISGNPKTSPEASCQTPGTVEQAPVMPPEDPKCSLASSSIVICKYLNGTEVAFQRLS